MHAEHIWAEQSIGCVPCFRATKRLTPIECDWTMLQQSRHALEVGRAMPNDLPAPQIPARLFRHVMGLFATGITVITVDADSEVRGMTANAFMAGSLEPPLCVISVRNESRMLASVVGSGRYGISFLSERQRHLSNHFAGRPLPGIEPEFERVAGVPVLRGALASIAVELRDTVACGDHTLCVGRIERMEAGEGLPLLFVRGRYARLAQDATIERIEPPAFW